MPIPWAFFKFTEIFFGQLPVNLPVKMIHGAIIIPKAQPHADATFLVILQKFPAVLHGNLVKIHAVIQNPFVYPHHMFRFIPKYIPGVAGLLRVFVCKGKELREHHHKFQPIPVKGGFPAKFNAEGKHVRDILTAVCLRYCIAQHLHGRLPMPSVLQQLIYDPLRVIFIQPFSHRKAPFPSR